MNTHQTYQYINDFLYFVIKPDTRRGEKSLLYCSGVDLFRFLPITKGRHRAMSNPCTRGLQLVNLGVRALALSNGATPKAARGNECAGLLPSRDGMYKDLLRIENAQESLPEEIINYCVINFMKKVFNAMFIKDVDLPDTLLAPDELQVLLEGLCDRFGS